MRAELRWYDDHGYLSACPDGVYNDAYFDKYVGYAATENGKAITRSRLELVRLFVGTRARVLDFGIGCGAFIDARNAQAKCIEAPPTVGYDIMPKSLDWLHSRGLHSDLWENPEDVVTFWDSAEHVEDFAALMGRVKRIAFFAIPIFRDREHVLQSHHYRPDEHFWYFTHDGLVKMMRRCGFDLLYSGADECQYGRKDIGSYAFMRREPWKPHALERPAAQGN